MTSFSDITTFAVGGEIKDFQDCKSTKSFVNAIKAADGKKEPLYIIGFGANTLALDKQFSGTVIRPQTHRVKFKRHKSCNRSSNCILATADAGVNFTDFVNHCIESSFSGLESLIGIPGTVGAAPVQNIGAYGSELADTFFSAEVFNRKTKKIETLFKGDMQFGYRSSILKTNRDKLCVSEKIILSVSLCLEYSDTAQIKNEQLAKSLNAEVGDVYSLYDISKELMSIRANKGTLIDPAQRINGFNVAQKSPASESSTNNSTVNKSSQFNYDRWSAGSFFTNPIVNANKLKLLPKNAPAFKIKNNEIENSEIKNSKTNKDLYKLSAGYLIEKAGFKKGFSVSKKASLSTLNNLVLTNRGDAKSDDILKLSKTVIEGVYKKFKIKLTPEVSILNY
ncbi:MAG: FAD-binding protein [Bifidobacteriaceae bacterium]|nr:FAD-binding protein [Bifidobacteriaceae bacterium]